MQNREDGRSAAAQSVQPDEANAATMTASAALAVTPGQSEASAFQSTILGHLGEAGQSPAAGGYARYAAIRELGRGGMGRVIEAEDRQFGRRVALKEQLRGSGPGDRFLREALVTANLEHPGIPAVYDRGVNEGGDPFYAMRLVEGRTLTSAIDEADRIEARLKLIPAVIAIANTVAFAHERGVVHRDIKPDNVILGRHGEAVLLDWGIAKLKGIRDTGGEGGLSSTSSKSTQHGAIVGTPTHMSPEQARGDVDRIDLRTDVFAIGALLYHVLTGRPPYDASNVAALLDQALRGSCKPVREIEPAAPPSLCAVVERAMARDPGDRYASAGELADALQDAVSEAFTGRDSKAVKVFIRFAGVFGLLLTLFSSALVWVRIPSLRQLGVGAITYLLFTVLGVSMSVVNYATRGRYRLEPMTLAFLGATLFFGVAQWSVGQGLVLGGARQVSESKGLAAGFEILMEGSREAIGSLPLMASLCAVQVLVWALTRQRATPAPDGTHARAKR